jgi:hypothetical protein
MRFGAQKLQPRCAKFTRSRGDDRIRPIIVPLSVLPVMTRAAPATSNATIVRVKLAVPDIARIPRTMTAKPAIPWIPEEPAATSEATKLSIEPRAGKRAATDRTVRS